MDADAALLANRTECEYDGDLNFDALLLGGYFCHVCLPDANCDPGGTCTNRQWEGYVCHNEFVVTTDDSGEKSNILVLGTTTGDVLDDVPKLRYGITYRFTVRAGRNVVVSLHDEGTDESISLPGNECGCASEGPLLLALDDVRKQLSRRGGRLVLKSSVGHVSMGIPYERKKCNNCRLKTSIRDLVRRTFAI